jgi:dienelactone hydrolase
MKARSPAWRLAVVPAVVLLTIGIGIGGPHLSKQGWSVGTSVGAVAAATGLAGFVVAGRAFAGVGRLGRVVSGVGAIALLGLSTLTLGQALAASWVPHVRVSRVPDDVGLDAEDVRFTTADGVELAAWYVPPRDGTAVVLAHGAGSTRSNVLEHAAALVDHGYGILAVDARGHGDSDGRAMDFGWWGDEDLGGAVDFLAARPEVEHIAALGLSMGGEEVIGAMAADERIEAAVAEGATVRVAGDKDWLSERYGWRGAAQEWIESTTTWLTDRFTPADPPITLRDAVTRASPRPVLLLAAGDVPDEGEAAGWIRGGAPDSVTVVELDGVGHTDGLEVDPERWVATVIGFLDRVIVDRGATP